MSRLEPGAADSLKQLVRVLVVKPRDSCAAPHEQHLSHNRLGSEGIVEGFVNVLEGVAEVGAGIIVPTYPLQLTACTSDRQTGWLRVERDGQPEQPPRGFGTGGC